MDRRTISDRCNMAGKNNRGSTLLLVIVAMSFIGTIAALILLITYKNLESIQTEMASTANFYSAESAMDELKAAFSEWADEAVRVSYTKWLQDMSETEVDDQEIQFRRMFVAEMRTKLEQKFNEYFKAETGGEPEEVPADPEASTEPEVPAEPVADSHSFSELFDSFGDNIQWNSAAGVPVIVTSDKDNTETTDDDTDIMVKNISILYRDSSGYSTAITTDMEFDIDFPGFAVNQVTNGGKACSEYVIIADGQINNLPTASVNIRGSLYGGGLLDGEYKQSGIKFTGNNTRIYANKIVSRNDLEICDGSKVVIKGLDADEDYTGDLHYADLWLKGIDITGDGPAKADIQGNCYINDDTTMSAKAADGSDLNISGSYYGYNISNFNVNAKDAQNVPLMYGTPEGSSSVILNSFNSRVDFTQCDPLWLAGKAFVSVADRYGPEGANNVAFPEGESLTFRGLQAAYMMPGDCIIGIGHNPITKKEYDALVDPEDTSVRIDLTRSAINGGVKLTDYVNIINPYRVAFVTYNDVVEEGAEDDSKLVYLYLNFTDADSAADYFRTYESKYDELVAERMGNLDNGRILFNPDTIISTGNVIGYEENEETGKVETSIVRANKEYNDSDIEDKQVELINNYSGLINALDENYTGNGNMARVTDSIVDFTKVDDPDIKILQIDDVDDAYDHYKLITGDDITISSSILGGSSYVSAIVIATGNVVIPDNITFTGLIIAAGDVTINGNYNAEPESVAYLAENNEAVARYFKFDTDMSSGGTVTSVDVVNIEYKNWKKN